MDAMVVPGAPVSVLVDHGIPDTLVEKLMEAGVATVEKLGGMTPEQLEEIPGIGDEMVEKIQNAVVSYYGQFESGGEGEAAPAEPVAAGSEVVEEKQAEAPQEQSVTIETAEAPAGAEALDKEQG
jgi:N utilization substance protein A